MVCYLGWQGKEYIYFSCPRRSCLLPMQRHNAGSTCTWHPGQYFVRTWRSWDKMRGARQGQAHLISLKASCFPSKNSKFFAHPCSSPLKGSLCWTFCISAPRYGPSDENAFPNSGQKLRNNPIFPASNPFLSLASCTTGHNSSLGRHAARLVFFCVVPGLPMTKFFHKLGIAPSSLSCDKAYFSSTAPQDRGCAPNSDRAPGMCGEP